MEDIDKTIPPQRENVFPAADDVTMPGKRDRKPDGRFQVGDLIMNRYKVLAELGQGGMGVVYKCFDETAGIEVALKALPPELSHNTIEMEDIKDNFQLVHNLHHPNIASSNTLERDISNGNYYLIMECCEGEDLRRWLKRKRKECELKLEEVLPIIEQVASALDYAHEMKIMHRDIKPGNIMIDQFGKIKVLDFGLAAQIHTSMTRVSMAYHGTSGTGPYMAPEQWEGRIQDARADQYALAVMTYEMLAGHTPFESTDAAVLREAVLKSKVISLENVPKYVDVAILRALSKEPAERFESCSEFAAALGGKKIKAGKVQKKGVFPKWAAAVLIAVLLGAVGTGLFIQQKNDKSPEKSPVAPATSVVTTPAPQPKQPDNNEREIAAMVQSTYRLQASVLSKKQDIESANYDRGETFGKYLDALKENFGAGELAMKNNDVTAANASFKAAGKAADWIIANAPLRKEFQSLQKEVNSQKTEADKFDAAKLSFAIYNAAVKKVAKSGRDYESGNFTPALSTLKSALADYKNAYTEARKLTLENLINSAERAQNNRQWDKVKEFAGKIQPLDPAKASEFTALAAEQIKLEKLNKELASARQAKENKNWQSVYDYAVAALNIDNSNTEAQNLKQEAENHLTPTLTVYAYVDGKTVNAIVKSLKSRPDQQSRPWKLQKGSEYEFEVTYKDGEDEYYGKIPAFTCTANGPHRKDITLTKVVFNGTVDCNGVKLEMVKIKAGTFMMGSPENELGRLSNDETRHRVTLTKDYWLGKYEVTQAQYEAIMGNNPAYFKGGKRPVEQVSWNDAKDFCRKLNERYAGKLPAGYKFDLPTEAQWEYACRAGTTTALNNGTNLTSARGACSNLDEVGWYDKNYGSNAHKEFGQKRPNNWGLYDMHGNVFEWCRDWYGSYTGDATDPLGPSSGSIRVFRGGSWSFCARFCRSANRDDWNPGDRASYLGFRLALVPVQ